MLGSTIVFIFFAGFLPVGWKGQADLPGFNHGTVLVQGGGMRAQRTIQREGLNQNLQEQQQQQYPAYSKPQRTWIFILLLQFLCGYLL